MKTKKLYRAKSTKIGLIEGTKNDYFIDVIQSNGNQQTIASGDFEYVKSNE